MDGTASTVRPIFKSTSATQVTPYTTVVILITGVVGGLILVISVILFCKYCTKKRNKVFRRRPALLTRLVPSSWQSVSLFKSRRQRTQYETVTATSADKPQNADSQEQEDDGQPASGINKSILSKPKPINAEGGEEHVEDLDIDAAVALYKESLKQAEEEDTDTKPESPPKPIAPRISLNDQSEDETKLPTFLLVSPIQPKDERDRKVSFLKLDRRTSATHWTSKQKSRRRYTEGDFHHLKLMRIERPVTLPAQRSVACPPFEQKRERHEAYIKKRSHSVFDDRVGYYRQVLRRGHNYEDSPSLSRDGAKLRPRDSSCSNRDRLASTRPEISDSPSPPTKAHWTEVAAEVHREASNGSASSRGSVHSMKDLIGGRRDSFNKLEIKELREHRQHSFSGRVELPSNRSSSSLGGKNELLQVRGNSFSGKTDHMRGSNSLKVKTEFSQARSRSSGYLGKENSFTRSIYLEVGPVKMGPFAGQRKASSFERSNTSSFDRHSGPGSFDRHSGPGSFDRHSAGSFERPSGSSFDRHSAGSFERPSGSSFDRQSGGSFERPTGSSFDRQSAASFERPTGSSFDRQSAASFERPGGSSFDRQSAASFERPGGSSFDRQSAASFDRQSAGSFDRHADRPPFERTVTTSERQTPPYDRHSLSPFDRQLDAIHITSKIPPPKTLEAGGPRHIQSHSLEMHSPTEKLSVAVLKSRKVKSYEGYMPDMDADRFEITQLRCDSSCVADLDLLAEDGSPELRSKVRYNDMGSFEDVSEQPYVGGGFEMEEVTVESSDTETLNGAQVYRELWNLRSTLEEEEDFSDTIRMEDMSSPDDQNHANRDNLNPVAGGAFEGKQGHRKSLNGNELPVTTASSNLLHPNYENRRQTFRNILSKRLKKIDAPLSAENSFDSVETMDTDGEVSEDTTSRHEVTTTSFESTTDNTDSTGDSHNQRLQLQQMRGDSGYKSLENQQTLNLPTTPPKSPKSQKLHVGPNVDDGLSIDVPAMGMDDEQRDSPSGASTIEMPASKSPAQKKYQFERRSARTASKKRREYGRERQAVHIYETLGGEAETDSKSDQFSGDSFDENQTPSKLSLFTRFFKSHSREKKIIRDYSIDEKSNELFNEFSRFDPKMEPRTMRRPHMYSRHRLHRKHDSVGTEFECRRGGKLRPERRSASLGSDSSASSVRRLSPQDSIEEEDYDPNLIIPQRKSSLPGFERMTPRLSSRIASRDIPIIRLPEEDLNEIV